MPELLTKSDYKATCRCSRKLYYRKLGYPNLKQEDPYLALLADGGYMVEKTARLLHPDGTYIDTSRGHAAAAEETRRLLDSGEDVTLFEATFINDGRLARVDILRRSGGRLELMEVKSKSFDSSDPDGRYQKTGSWFRGKRSPFAVTAEWREYLEDVAFQYAVVCDEYPDLAVVPYLVLVDKAYTCDVEGLATLFRLVRREDGRILEVEFTGDADEVRANPLTAAIDVTAEVEELEPEVRARAVELCALLDPDLVRAPANPNRECARCEYDLTDADRQNGFAECWGDAAAERPLVLDLYQGRTLIDALIEEGIVRLRDVPDDRIQGDGAYAQRQRVQLAHTRSGEEWIDPSLGAELRRIHYPLHFIDFEAARLAVPHHKGMRPYGVRAFQWSCHTVDRPDGLMSHREWLNNEDPWPNRAFAASLREAVGDQGSVLVWSPYEGSILRDIAGELTLRDGTDDELVDWLVDTADGDRIVDLHALCRRHYFHPHMGGRTSIKTVLEAVWLSFPEVRRRFEGIEGFPGDPQLGPYAALPPIRIGERAEIVAEGTGAVRAYEAMMYGLERDDPEVRRAWRELLLQYCRLDTLAMVLIWEHWMRRTAS
jgi:hypothetical protein